MRLRRTASANTRRRRAAERILALGSVKSKPAVSPNLRATPGRPLRRRLTAQLVDALVLGGDLRQEPIDPCQQRRHQMGAIAARRMDDLSLRHGDRESALPSPSRAQTRVTTPQRMRNYSSGNCAVRTARRSCGRQIKQKVPNWNDPGSMIFTHL